MPRRPASRQTLLEQTADSHLLQVFNALLALTLELLFHLPSELSLLPLTGEHVGSRLRELSAELRHLTL